MKSLKNKLNSVNLYKLIILFFCLLMITIIPSKLFAREDPPNGEGFQSVSVGSATYGSIDYSEYVEALYYMGVYGASSQRWGCDYINFDIMSASYAWYINESSVHGVSAIGPISVEGGGDMPLSDTHENGTCVDVRLIGFDGAYGEVTWQDYDRQGNFEYIMNFNDSRELTQVMTGDSVLEGMLDAEGIPADYDSTGKHKHHNHLQFVK